MTAVTAVGLNENTYIKKVIDGLKGSGEATDSAWSRAEQLRFQRVCERLSVSRTRKHDG